MRLKKRISDKRTRRRIYRTDCLVLFDDQIIEDSISRLKEAGITTQKEIQDIKVRWGPAHSEKKYWIAYCYIDRREIILTRSAYRMPKWAIDTVLWHEYAHVLSRSPHGTTYFKRANRRRRLQALQEFIVLFLDFIGIYKT